MPERMEDSISPRQADVSEIHVAVTFTDQVMKCKLVVLLVMLQSHRKISSCCFECLIASVRATWIAPSADQCKAKTS